MAALTGKLNEGDDPAAIKIILFYQYFPQSLVDALGAEGDHAPLYQELYNYQLEQCSALGLLGRVLISTQGINGTLSGTVDQIDRYIELMGVYSIAHSTDKGMVTLRPFETVDWKSSLGQSNKDEPFPDLAIRKVKELVASDGMKYNVNDNGTHLSPSEFHRILTEAPENLVLLDVRIGAFSIALCIKA